MSLFSCFFFFFFFLGKEEDFVSFFTFPWKGSTKEEEEASSKGSTKEEEEVTFEY